MSFWRMCSTICGTRAAGNTSPRSSTTLCNTTRQAWGWSRKKLWGTIRVMNLWLTRSRAMQCKIEAFSDPPLRLARPVRLTLRPLFPRQRQQPSHVRRPGHAEGYLSTSRRYYGRSLFERRVQDKSGHRGSRKTRRIFEPDANSATEQLTLVPRAAKCDDLIGRPALRTRHNPKLSLAEIGGKLLDYT